jgi:hypothetical protein
MTAERIAGAIHVVRGQRVMLDADLAALYGVSTGRLNEQVKRNAGRFPADFGFRLTPEEAGRLKSQIAISNGGRGGRRTTPNVFTEHGAVMLASVLNTPVAVATSVQVVRAFVRLRHVLRSHTELARKIDALEERFEGRFHVVFRALRRLTHPAAAPRKRIGFRPAPEGRAEGRRRS